MLQKLYKKMFNNNSLFNLNKNKFKIQEKLNKRK